MRNYLPNNLLAICIFVFIHFLMYHSSQAQDRNVIQFDDNSILALSQQYKSNDQVLHVHIPTTHNTLSEFALLPEQIIDGKLLKQFPNHNNYKIVSVDNKPVSGKVLISPNGVFVTMSSHVGFKSLRNIESKNIYSCI